MKRFLAFFLLFTSACQEPVIRYKFFGKVQPGDEELMEEGAAILGFPIERMYEDAPIRFDLLWIDDQRRRKRHEVGGYTLRRNLCSYTSWAIHDPKLIAHELGHAFLSIEDSPIKGNVMNDHPGLELTDTQVATLESEILASNAFCISR